MKNQENMEEGLIVILNLKKLHKSFSINRNYSKPFTYISFIKWTDFSEFKGKVKSKKTVSILATTSETEALHSILKFYM